MTRDELLAEYDAAIDANSAATKTAARAFPEDEFGNELLLEDIVKTKKQTRTLDSIVALVDFLKESKKVSAEESTAGRVKDTFRDLFSTPPGYN
jgi:hypothetical protein